MSTYIPNWGLLLRERIFSSNPVCNSLKKKKNKIKKGRKTLLMKNFTAYDRLRDVIPSKNHLSEMVLKSSNNLAFDDRSQSLAEEPFQPGGSSTSNNPTT